MGKNPVKRGKKNPCQDKHEKQKPSLKNKYTSSIHAIRDFLL
jgi:hypothetical protein